MEVGSDQDCEDQSGMTALTLATTSGHLEIARLVVEADAGTSGQTVSSSTRALFSVDQRAATSLEDITFLSLSCMMRLPNKLNAFRLKYTMRLQPPAA